MVYQCVRTESRRAGAKTRGETAEGLEGCWSGTRRRRYKEKCDNGKRAATDQVTTWREAEAETRSSNNGPASRSKQKSRREGRGELMRASWPCEDIVGGEGSVCGAGAEIIGNYRALEGRESSERRCAPASYNIAVMRPLHAFTRRPHESSGRLFYAPLRLRPEEVVEDLRAFLLGAQRVRVVGLHLIGDTTHSIIRA